MALAGPMAAAPKRSRIASIVSDAATQSAATGTLGRACDQQVVEGELLGRLAEVAER